MPMALTLTLVLMLALLTLPNDRYEDETNLPILRSLCSIRCGGALCGEPVRGAAGAAANAAPRQHAGQLRHLNLLQGE